MDSGTQIAVEGLGTRGELERLVRGAQPCVRKRLRNVSQYRGRFGQYSALGDQRRHATLGVDGRVLGLALVAGAWKSSRTAWSWLRRLSSSAIWDASAQEPGA